MGDPAGVGPEVTLKALQREEVWRAARPLVIGDARVLDRVSQRIGIEMQIDSFSDVEEASFKNQNPQVLDLANVEIESLHPDSEVIQSCWPNAVNQHTL
jgi:4-hydroxythreonine-4-phosphate dehydrogenase